MKKIFKKVKQIYIDVSIFLNVLQLYLGYLFSKDDDEIN